MKELQRKYGKDQQKLSQEMMKLYKETGVNPVGGCLPLLLQLPIFIGVYQAILHLMIEDQRKNLTEVLRAVVVDNNVEPLLNQSFPWGALWNFVGVTEANDITRLLHQTFLGIDVGKAPFNPFPNLEGPQYLVLPILAIVLLLVQQLMAMPRVQDPQQKMMSQMMMFTMPVFFAFVAFTFPSGAAIYWVTTSVFGIVQQYFISGWGSLANHLTFLPADRVPNRGLVPATAVAGEGGGSVPESAAPEAARPTFWDVMRQLTEDETTDGDDGGVSETAHDQGGAETQDHEEQKKKKASSTAFQRSPRSRVNRKSSGRRRRS
jgi:YidC/Oxa1 family membrane protein insertase